MGLAATGVRKGEGAGRTVLASRESMGEVVGREEACAGPIGILYLLGVPVAWEHTELTRHEASYCLCLFLLKCYYLLRVHPVLLFDVTLANE